LGRPPERAIVLSHWTKLDPNSALPVSKNRDTLSLALDRKAPYRREAKEFPQEHGGIERARVPKEMPLETPGSFTETTTIAGTTTTSDRSYRKKTHRRRNNGTGRSPPPRMNRTTMTWSLASLASLLP
jgi:hypothetical protein